jgi:diaminohydroxyphosphoribosylaminopyrimidine deaminase / 5-amino-6-(5-phosphoribosylamino)uracil reductase
LGRLFMDYMAMALRLAARARGQTSPNPMVGAVIVRDGRIVGEGYHRRAGEAHAEILALQQAGAAARGATLFVTLEPCCCFGRTPPCTTAVIAAGIAEVHAAMIDPNPRVGGGGLRELNEAGIRTVLGEHGDEAQRLNEVFVCWMTRRRPFVIAKYAMTLDGKIATRTGESRGLTGPAWQRDLHRLRGHVDAILVGVNTVLADDPLLTVRRRGYRGRQPLRVVLDSTLRIPLEARILDAALPGRTLVVTTSRADEQRRIALQQRGAEVLVAGDTRVDIGRLLAQLSEREITSVLVEGGGQVTASFVDAGLVDKVIAVIAPLIAGGASAPTPVEGEGVAGLAGAMRLDRLTVRRTGADTVITGYPVRTENT